MQAVVRLGVIITLTWVLLLSETYVFFGLIRPLYPNIHESVPSALIKIAATVILVFVWVVAMFLMERGYVRSTSHPTRA